MKMQALGVSKWAFLWYNEGGNLNLMLFVNPLV